MSLALFERDARERVGRLVAPPKGEPSPFRKPAPLRAWVEAAGYTSAPASPFVARLPPLHPRAIEHGERLVLLALQRFADTGKVSRYGNNWGIRG